MLTLLEVYKFYPSFLPIRAVLYPNNYPSTMYVFNLTKFACLLCNNTQTQPNRTFISMQASHKVFDTEQFICEIN